MLAAGVLALAGCATPDRRTYVTPGKEADSASLSATSRRESLMSFEHYRLLALDDGFHPRSAADVVKVDPGARRTVVIVTFRNGFGTHVHDAVVSVNALLEKGGSYAINGKVEGVTVRAWVEETPSGRLVSNIGLGVGQVQAQAGAPIPVLIPAR